MLDGTSCANVMKSVEEGSWLVGEYVNIGEEYVETWIDKYSFDNYVAMIENTRLHLGKYHSHRHRFFSSFEWHSLLNITRLIISR